MTNFQQAWAVVKRDFRPIDGEDADIHSVLKVYRSEKDALKEVQRLKETEGSHNLLFWCEETEVEQR